MASPAWEADKMLDAYIYDYLQKRKLARSAEAFMVEANISPDPVAIDAPGGFLFEWWSVFWDIFIARTNEKHSEVAHSYIEAQQAKVKEQQQQALQQQQAAQLQVAQQLQQQQQQAQQGLSSQQQAGSHWQLLQSQLQQQRQAAQRRENVPNGSTTPGLSTENLLRQSPANLLATKLYQDNLKGASRLPEGLSLDEAILKRFSEANSGHGLQPQQAALLRSTSSNAAGLQNSLSELDNSIARQLLAANGSTNQLAIQQARAHLLSPSLSQDDKASLMGRQPSPPRGDMVAALSKAGFAATQLVNQGGGKIWPASNIEQIRAQQQQQAAQQQLQQVAQQQQAAAQQQQQQHSQQAVQQVHQQQAAQSQGQLQRQGSNVSAGQFQFQSPQQFQQFQMLSPLQQRELLLHAQQQQQAAASGVSQQERLRQMMGGKGFGHEGSQNGSPGASSGSQGQGQALPLQQQELLLKLQAQRSANQLQAQFHQQQQQVAAAAAALQKGGASTPGNSPHLQQLIRQGSNHSLQGLGANGVILPPGVDHPATSTDSRKTGKGAPVRKRKQPGTNSNAVPTSSTGTGTTVGGSMAVGPEPPTPTNNRNEALLASLQQSSEALRGAHGVFQEGRADAPASSDPNPEDGSIDHVETFLSEAADEDHLRNALFAGGKRDEPDPKEIVTSGFSFAECGVLRASTGKVVSCHFSVDGKILATAGHDKKAILWDLATHKIRGRLEEHTLIVTDVRFAATSNRLATSSFDKTVRVWDADSESACSLRVFARHQQTVMSVDFHPANDDVVCSCDSDGEVRMWSVDKGTCTRVFKGASMQVRFQPRTGSLLAMASEGSVTMYDVESEQCRIALQRHAEPLQAVCWEPNGDVMASVSEDSVRIWAFGSGASEGECLHELISSGNKFHSCVFHPTYASLLVIGCYESLELWNMMENKSMTVMAHEGLIASLAQSQVTGMVASASHDKSVKLWK